MLAQWVQTIMTATTSSEKSRCGCGSLRQTGNAVSSESNFWSVLPQTEQVIVPTRLRNQSRIWRIWCSFIGIRPPVEVRTHGQNPRHPAFYSRFSVVAGSSVCESSTSTARSGPDPRRRARHFQPGDEPGPTRARRGLTSPVPSNRHDDRRPSPARVGPQPVPALLKVGWEGVSGSRAT